MATPRHHARRRWRDDFHQSPAGEILFLLHDFDDDFFPGNRVGDEHDAPGIVPSHRLAACGHRCKFQVQGFAFHVSRITFRFCVLPFHLITSIFMYGRNTSGTTMLPSFC